MLCKETFLNSDRKSFAVLKIWFSNIMIYNSLIDLNENNSSEL